MLGSTCGLCNVVLNDKSALMVHIGTRHGKLDDILEIKGFPKLVNTGRVRKPKENSNIEELEYEAVQNNFAIPLKTPRKAARKPQQTPRKAEMKTPRKAARKPQQTPRKASLQTPR